jgi:hypothetical protein
MKEIIICVNGLHVDTSNTFPLYQKEPFPGGNTYNLELQFDSEELANRFIKETNIDRINNLNWSVFFLKLASFWPVDKQNKNAAYLINNVEKVEFNGKSVLLEGVCSPVVGQTHSS